MEALSPGTVHEVLHRSCRLAQADAEGIRHLVRRKAEHPRCCGCRAKGATGRCWMETPIIMISRYQRQAQSNLHLVTSNDTCNHLPAVRARHLCRSQRSRHDGCARMDRAARVGVVEIERVREGPVDERRAGWRVAPTISNDARPSLRQAKRTSRSHQARRRFGILPGPHGNSHMVGHQQLGPLPHFRR